ncbi:MAG: lipid asymmetry maintenance protein MlaB [Thiobacillaceae bacterium]
MRCDGQVLILEDDLTLEHARRLLGLGAEAITQGVTEVDFAGAGKVDSSALSLMLAWRRRAHAVGRRLEFRNVPDSLRSLARLYGVDALLR